MHPHTPLARRRSTIELKDTVNFNSDNVNANPSRSTIELKGLMGVLIVAMGLAGLSIYYRIESG